MEPIAAALERTMLSQLLQDTAWAVPLLQTLHILGIALLFTSACLMNARLAGLVGRDEVLSDTVPSLGRAVWTGLAVLAVTGLALVMAEPHRELENQLFWTKMALVAASVLITAWGLRRARGRAGRELSAGDRRRSRALAILSVLLWVTIIFCGRWIAYFDVFAA